MLDMIHLFFRQEDRDVEARLSTNDASLTDWHLGFDISQVCSPYELIPYMSCNLAHSFFNEKMSSLSLFVSQ